MLIEALKNLSIIGALFIIAGYGAARARFGAGLRGRLTLRHHAATA